MSFGGSVWLWNDPVTGYLCRGGADEVPEGVSAVELDGVVEVMPDAKEHWNASAGCVIRSRADRREMMKREGLRECSVSDPGAALKAAAAAQSDRIRHPEKYGGQSLAAHHYEVFHGSGGDRKDVRRMIEESRGGGDAEMGRRWREGRVRR